jgi:transcriptional regulator with XRE-family HTH domain
MGVSLKMLSVKSGIGYNHLNRMELGKVNFRISYLFKLAKVLETDPEKLLP